MLYFGINNWFRALARFCDYCIFYLALGAVTLSLPYFYGPFFYYFLALAIPLLWVPVEAFFISRWATTPGKALFGLSVRTRLGISLDYKEALKWACFLPHKPGVVYQKKTGWKRKLCAFLTASTFVLAALYGNALTLWSVGLEKGPMRGWVNYSSEEAGFKVSFPKDPELASKELVIPDSNKVLPYKELTSNESRKVQYSVSHLDLPRKWRFASNTTLLKGVLKLLVEHEPGSQLITKEFKNRGQLRVLDYKIQHDEQELQGRLIIIGGTLYKLTVAYPTDKADPSQVIAFLDSFEKT